MYWDTPAMHHNHKGYASGAAPEHILTVFHPLFQPHQPARTLAAQHAYAACLRVSLIAKCLWAVVARAPLSVAAS